jgi:hypothetical protein
MADSVDTDTAEPPGELGNPLNGILEDLGRSKPITAAAAWFAASVNDVIDRPEADRCMGGC